MSSKLRLYVGRKVIECLQKSSPNIITTQIQPIIHSDKKNYQNIIIKVPLSSIQQQIGSSEINKLGEIEPDEIIKKVEFGNQSISFEIDRNIFIKDTIDNCTKIDILNHAKKIVVEYSSPNVAKPFHFGHLRSTIIGNFVSNLNAFFKNDVTRLNYLGDWGTQFGFIKVGVRELKYNEEDIKKDPIQLLFKSYVYANKLSENDPSVLEKAKEEFAKLERGDKEDIEQWKQYLSFTKNELIGNYSRLGVVFDEYNSESMYGKQQITSVLDMLRKNRVLVKDKDGKEVAKLNNRDITLVKSDGSTLYLSRDIAAAMDRFEKYKFDKMYYVVENGQHDHFTALKGILKKMYFDWANNIEHIKFGRIKGMSTRKGNAVFLRDILDECREKMIKKQLESPTTKVPINNGEIADILGVSCVIINDLKQRRLKDYDFDWEKVLQVKGDTGIKLQYTHCRLHNINKNSGVIPAVTCDPSVLREPEVIILLKELARFQDVLSEANDQLEAAVLVIYLFHLCNHINRTIKVLKVKGSSPDVASQRLLLFNTARNVLNTGMSILGLKPLNEM